MISLNLSPSLNPGLLHKTRTCQQPTRLSALLITNPKPFNHRHPLGLSPIPNLQIRDVSAKPLLSLTNPESSSGFSRKPRSIAAVGSSDSNPDEKSDLGEAEKKEKKAKTLQLGIVFGLWYFQNIVFNIFNKKALNVFPYPWLLASFQLFAGSIWMLVLWSFKLYPCPKISKPFIIALLGPALFHTIGHISACVSFSKVAVSFTHVIKSAEPVFSVIFSSLLGDSYPLAVWLSILPIVMGCSLAAVTEVSFNLGGLSGAMISNVGFVLRNIYSKRSLQSFKEIDGLNLYGCISILSLLYLFPVAIFVEGSHWVPGYHKAIASVGTPSTFYFWVLLSGVFYHLYNQSSYQALDEISPLTFSVGNTMKRVVVIISTVLVFRNPVRPLNALGSAIAICGTFLYSQATAKKKKIEVGGDKKN
ncbi:Triose phosphate/phosphoenolpyruvate translocator [Arabidopsis suecica]|uniref:Triose phosphate/phosphoenolpyruvate translocator n=1 Tax=Arabidopsis suecica TaxID=45249 RepID=A0A8T2DJN6_ARASU|nr:Triose phosphate/phosphoenolpyruvate translocator [Arabidopsis suecica]